MIDLPEVLRQHALWRADPGKGRRAYLTGANLTGADLTRAYLAGANLAGAYLTGADLARADLTRAYLAGATGLPAAPVIDHIDARILACINGGKIDMKHWHSECQTTHCRGGWAIHLAGNAGRKIEAETSPYLAARLIYEASRPAQACPDFFCTDEEAMDNLQICAAKDPLP